MRTRIFAVSSVLLAVFALSATVMFGADMFSGTWKLNAAKSTGTDPRSTSVQKIQFDDNGLKLVFDDVNAAGQKVHQEFTVQFDGKDYPFKSTHDGKPDETAPEMISAKKIDDYTVEFTVKSNGKVSRVNKNVVSKDGKTRTVRQIGTNAQGQPLNRTVIYEKQ